MKYLVAIDAFISIFTGNHLGGLTCHRLGMKNFIPQSLDCLNRMLQSTILVNPSIFIYLRSLGGKLYLTTYLPAALQAHINYT